jgi:hypothetical protein
MNAVKHEHPSQATDTTSTAPPTIDSITRFLQTKRVRTADFFFPSEGNVDTTPYFPIINSCVYDLYKDHRGINSAKAWILS